MSGMSDLQLYYNYKSTNNPSVILEFFKRYKKLINKIYYHYFRGFTWYYCYDDFKQEAFIILYKTLKDVDENKIHTPETWKLYDMYKWYLCNAARNIRTKVRKELNNSVLVDSENLDDREGKPLSDFNLIAHSFMKNLTEKEKIIFYRKNLSYNTWTLERLSRNMSMPISTLSKINRNLIKKFEEFYK